MSKENEFARRDAMGLKPLLPNAKTESETRQRYFKMIGLFNFVIAPTFATGLIWITTNFISSPQQTHADRLKLLREYDLGYLYISYYILMLTRSYATINANGTREEARVDRPDQHAYKIMANPQNNNTVNLSNAPYVLMENVGPIGRFNRAQRAAFHFDEGLELLLGSIFLAGIVYPQLVFGLTLVYCVGRKGFTDGYTESCEGRMGPFLLVVLPSMIIAALVGIIAVQAIM